MPTSLPPPAQPLIGSRILTLREQRVMLDTDLGELYGIETRTLVQAVKRSRERFPEDFMFQLDNQELAILRSQFVISSGAHGGRRTAPWAFTELGVAMLSSVLNSPRAIAVNIEIMRTFVHIRALAATHSDWAHRLEALEAKTAELAAQHNALTDETRARFREVIDTLRQMMTPPASAKRPIGFVTDKT